jgi:hypothetical protein
MTATNTKFGNQLFEYTQPQGNCQPVMARKSEHHELVAHIVYVMHKSNNQKVVTTKIYETLYICTELLGNPQP